MRFLSRLIYGMLLAIGLFCLAVFAINFYQEKKSDGFRLRGKICFTSFRSGYTLFRTEKKERLFEEQVYKNFLNTRDIKMINWLVGPEDQKKIYQGVNFDSTVTEGRRVYVDSGPHYLRVYSPEVGVEITLTKRFGTGMSREKEWLLDLLLRGCCHCSPPYGS